MKLTKKKLADFAATAKDRAAGGSHDHINECVHDTAVDEVADLLRGHGIDYDRLTEDQQETLLAAYKEGFWNPTGRTDEIQIVIHVEGGIVQCVTANAPVIFAVADTDAEGSLSDEVVRVPKALAPRLGVGHLKPAAKMLRFWQQVADVDPAAVAATFAIARK